MLTVADTTVTYVKAKTDQDFTSDIRTGSGLRSSCPLTRLTPSGDESSASTRSPTRRPQSDRRGHFPVRSLDRLRRVPVKVLATSPRSPMVAAARDL